MSQQQRDLAKDVFIRFLVGVLREPQFTSDHIRALITIADTPEGEAALAAIAEAQAGPYGGRLESYGN